MVEDSRIHAQHRVPPNDDHTVNGVHPGRYQPAWYSVDVPKTGTTIRVDGFGKKGSQINLSVN